MSAYPNTWLWDNDWEANFLLAVHSTDADADAEPLYTLALHSVVLAGASPGHLRAHCLRRTETETSQDTDHVHVHVHIHTSSSVPKHMYEYRLTLLHGEPETVPKAVLCHLYTGALPDDPEQLIWMLRRADYLDLADTVHAVLQKLISAGSKQLTLQHAALLHCLPAFQCDTWHRGEPGKPAQAAAPGPAAVGLLQQLINGLLLAHLPSAPAIVTDAALLAQFTQLPLALVKRWVKLDKYEVDSGNTLAVLFTAWHDAQPEPPSDEQCEQLSDMLPLAAVTLCFHAGALQHCKWWRRSISGSDTLVVHALAFSLRDSKEVQDWWKHLAGKRQLAARTKRKHKRTWTVTAEQLRQLWQDRRLDLPGFYLAGYQLCLYLVLTRTSESAASFYLGVNQGNEWPSILLAHGLGDRGSRPMEAANTYVRVRHGDGAVLYETRGRDWVHGTGWDITKHPYGSLEHLVPSPTTTLTLDCEVSLP